MLNRLLSHDTPRSRVLALLLLALLLALVFTPFALPGVKALNVAAKVVVFTVLVASFDVLLGYSGMVSFAHTMFFGIGAYGQAIALSQLGPSWSSVGLGLLAALLLSAALSLLMGLFSLRVRAIFFAMISLAVASAFQTLASQLSNLTGGEDGLSFKVPALLSPSTEFFDEPLWGVTLDGRLLCYYLLCWRCSHFCRCCALSTRHLAGCCKPFAKTSFVPRPLATAWWSIAPWPAWCRPCTPVWRARC